MIVIKRQTWQKPASLSLLIHLLLLLACIGLVIDKPHVGQQTVATIHTYITSLNSNGIAGNHEHHSFATTIASPQSHGAMLSKPTKQSSTQQIAAGHRQQNMGHNKLLMALHRAIQQQQQYPSNALLNNESGKSLIGFTLQRNGIITHIHVLHSSGYDDLDRAAFAAVQAISPFTQMMTGHTQNLQVSVEFGLGLNA